MVVLSSKNEQIAAATNNKKLLYKSQTANKFFFPIHLDFWFMKGLVTINQSALMDKLIDCSF